MKRSLLDPGNTRGAVSRLAGARRRVRAQNNADLCASSSSNESLTTTSKNSRRRTPRHQFLALRRGSSPICNVILTIEAVVYFLIFFIHSSFYNALKPLRPRPLITRLRVRYFRCVILLGGFFFNFNFK